MLASSVQAVAACSAAVLRVCTLVLFFHTLLKKDVHVDLILNS